MLSAGEDKRNVPIEGSRLSGFFNNPACGPVRTRYACSVHGASMSEWALSFRTIMYSTCLTMEGYGLASCLIKHHI
jgi:hypothetical protein